MNHKLFYPNPDLPSPSNLHSSLSLRPSTFYFSPPIVLACSMSRQVLCIALPRAAKLMLYSILRDHTVFTFTHPEEEEEEEEGGGQQSNDDNEEEEVRQHDEKHEDVKKEEAEEEEERKCRARRVYLGHLYLHPRRPPPPLSIPPSPHISHPPASAARCLFQSTYFCWLGC